MTRKHETIFYILIGLAGTLFTLAIVLGVVMNLDHGPIPVLFPHGRIAVEERNLLLIATFLMLLVVIPVFILTFAFAWYYRDSNTKAVYRPKSEGDYSLEIAWWAIPFAIILGMCFLTWYKTHELSPYRPIENGTKPLTIQVVALDWKWFFIYPEQSIATVNYLQIPENTPIAFEITADAPMNSFWIPALGGQMYAMPGMKSQLHLIADGAGTFDGSSANISGKGFAGMRFPVKATDQKSFEDWVASVQKSAEPIDLEVYKKLAEPAVDVPQGFYTLGKKDLFTWIVMKYMMPMEGG